MSTTLRVATLETALTINDDGLVTGLAKAKKATDDLDGTTAGVAVQADPAAALRDIARIADKAEQLDRARPRVDVEADAARALRDLERLADEAKDLDRTRTDMEILADTEDAHRRLTEAADELKALDGDKATVTVDVDQVGAEKGLGRAGELTGEFRDEAMQNFSEVTSSFAGDMQSIGDLAQGTLGGLASGIGGPLGIALGAAAVGVGVLINKLSTAAEEAEALVTETAELANQIVEAGGALEAADYASRFREWSAEIADSANWFERLVGLQEESTTNLDELSESAGKAGVSVEELVNAMSSGDVDKQRDLLGRYTDASRDLDAQVAAATATMSEHLITVGEAGPVYDEVGLAASRQRDALMDQKDALSDVSDELRVNVQRQEDAQRRADMLEAATEGVSVAQLKMQRAVDKANQALDDASGKARDVAQAQIDLASQIDETTRVMTETDKKTGELTSTELDRKQALLDLASQIVETASAQSDASGKTEDYNAVIAANRQAFIDAAAAAGITGQAAEDLADSYGLIPKQVDTDISSNAADREAELDSLQTTIDNLHGKEIPIEVSTRAAKLAVDELNSYIATHTSGTRRVNLPGRVSNANGNILEFANGAENHVAQIAPAGAWRVWAEDETGGEAYIPLAQSKRARSEQILDDVAGRFGMLLVRRANGSVDIPAAGPRTQSAQASGPTIMAPITVVTDDPRLAATFVAEHLTSLGAA